jgi:hypothetical protein
MTCPHCGRTDRYTDPLGNVRCTGCFNHVPGSPAPPIGQVQDLDAPMVIHPQPPIRGENA